MKKLFDLVRAPSSPTAIDDALKVLAEVIKDDKEITAAIDKLPKEIIIENISTILAYSESQINCKSCIGLDHCTSPYEGHTPLFSIKEKKFFTETKQCKYFKNFKDVSDKINSYLYDSLDGKYTHIKKRDIDLSDNERNTFLLNAKKYIETKSCYLYGKPSIGKTYITYALANTVAEKGNHKIVFAKVSHLMRDIKSKMGDKTLSGFIDKLKRATFVIFDDIGSKKLSEWEATQFLDILESLEGNSHFIFTSNYDLKTLEKKICNDSVIAAKICILISSIAEEVELIGKRRTA